MFGYKELAITNTMERLNHIRDILDAHNIPHRVKTMGLDGIASSLFGGGIPSRRAGSVSTNASATKLYYIYVPKKKLHEAKHLTGK
ncbi:MAG: hypothetical protein ACOX3W_09430 [Christensenellaceae bacterium]|jgi:hypothetical protein